MITNFLIFAAVTLPTVFVLAIAYMLRTPMPKPHFDSRGRQMMEDALNLAAKKCLRCEQCGTIRVNLRNDCRCQRSGGAAGYDLGISLARSK